MIDDYNSITGKIIGCVYTVANYLGSGFLEKVYENSLVYELRNNGFWVEQQCKIPVRYKNIIAGNYVADIIVEDKVILELKCVRCFEPVHMAQCLNYLKATGYEVCLLVNFGKPKVEVKRIVATDGAAD